jgi:hypothetical protein
VRRPLSVSSYPFEKPKTGEIAVKVISHYGDEVLKVYEIKWHETLKVFPAINLVGVPDSPARRDED